MEGDEGTVVTTQTVPAIGGVEGRSDMVPEVQTVQVVASAHLSDANRANGIAYNENPGVDVTTEPYPQGTRMSDSTPGERVN